MPSVVLSPPSVPFLRVQAGFSRGVGRGQELGGGSEKGTPNSQCPVVLQLFLDMGDERHREHTGHRVSHQAPGQGGIG